MTASRASACPGARIWSAPPTAAWSPAALVTTLLDHIGGLAVWTALDAFQPIATVDLRVDYMRAARPHRDLLAQGVCYRMTHTIAFVRAWAFEDDPSDPVAAAQSAYIFNPSRERLIGAAA